MNVKCFLGIHEFRKEESYFLTWNKCKLCKGIFNVKSKNDTKKCCDSEHGILEEIKDKHHG